MNNLFIQDIAIDQIALFNTFISCIMLNKMLPYALYLQQSNNKITNAINKKVIKFVDFIWTLIPILMIILITIPTFAILFELDKLHKILIKLVTIGNQWFWT